MADQAHTGNTTPRVLVVDDNEMSRKLIQFRLEKDGYGVDVAASGEEALGVVESGPVSLIFLDLVMEGMSGLDVLGTLKADDRHRGIPVVIVSGVEDADAVDQCLAAGASDFLPKPVKPAILQEVVADLLGPAPAADAGAGQETGIDLAGLAVFDTTFISQMVSDYGKDTAVGFINRFLDLAPAQGQAITAAAESGDALEWRRTVSGLKGGARTLGLAQLAGVCREIERALTNDQADDAQNTTGTLGGHLERALNALRDHAAAM